MAVSSSSGSLPLSLNVAGYHLTVNLLTPEQAPAAYRLVCEEALHGEDVGRDEFASEAHVKGYIVFTPCYSLTDTKDDSMKAVIVISPTTFSRMFDPVLADGKIICARHIKRYIIEHLIQLAVHLATDLGYEGLLIEAYRTSPLLSTLRSQGFHVTGCIPNSGNLIKHGWTDSFITLKEFQAKKTKQEQAVPESRDDAPESDPGGEGYCLAFKVRRPRLSYLPRRYTFSSGQEVVVRYVREEDIPVLYDMYREASRAGDGYSTDEFPSLFLFRFYAIDHAHAFVLEDPATSTILVSLSLTPSNMHRSANPNASDAFMIVKPSSKGKRLGTEASTLLTRLSLDLGYTCGSGDVILKNAAMLKIIRNQGFTIVGFIPKASRGPDNQIEDVVLFSRDLSERLKFVAKF